MDTPEPHQAAPENPPPAPAPRRGWIFHPLLFAAFPVLSLLAHNRHEAHLAWAAVPLAAALGLAVALWVVFGWVLRDRAKGALAASLVVLLFFSFGHTVAPLADSESAGWPMLALQIVLAEAALVGVAGLLLYRLRRPPVGLTVFANVAGIVLVALPLVNLAWFELSRPGGQSEVPSATQPEPAPSGGGLPDIYLIIPDAHARSDVMRDLYGHDMEPFLAELEGMGFAVARESAANYSMTPFSIASMLNLRYLEEAQDLAWGDLHDATRLIRDSELERLLAQRGYKTVAFPTGAPYTEMRHFDQYYRGLGAAAGFYRLFVGLTPVSILLQDNPAWNRFISDRGRILFTLDKLPEIARDPAPTFAFVHLELPHPPFRFGENGEDVFAQYQDLDDDGIGSRSPALQTLYPEAYRRQLIYTDRRLIETVGDILGASDRPPVILILSDHGPRMNFHWRDPQQADAREALANLTAVYLPGGAPGDLLYPDITPVNVLRRVLNETFGTDFKPLDDTSWLSSDINGRHVLTDVTDRVQGAPVVPGPRE